LLLKQEWLRTVGCESAKMNVELLVNNKNVFVFIHQKNHKWHLQKCSSVRKLCISLSGIRFKINLKSSTVTEIDLSL